MRHLKVKPGKPDHHEDIGNVRVTDGLEHLVAPAGAKIGLFKVCGFKSDRTPGYTDLPSVYLLEEFVNVLCHQVNYILFERFISGYGNAFPNRLLYPFPVSSLVFRDSPGIGGHIVHHLL